MVGDRVMTRRTGGPARWRRLAMAGTVMAVSVGLSLVALPLSGASPSTKNYSVAPIPQPAPMLVGVPYPATLTLTNDSSSNQSFGSVQLSTLPQSSITVGSITPALGWHSTYLAGGVVQLTSDNGAAIAPGHTLAVGVTITATTAGSLTVTTAVKQSNDFSGSNNSFTNTGANPTLVVTALSLSFSQQPPPSVQQSVPKSASWGYLCPPVSVRVNPPVANIAITITPVGTPGLYYGTSPVPLTGPSPGVTVSTDASGFAVFGSCSSGLAATVLGQNYALTANSPAAAAPITSTPFSVVQVATTCTTSCSQGLTSGTTGATGNLTVNGNGTFALLASFGQGVALSCSSLVASVAADPLVVSTSGTSTNGTVTLTFPKSVVNSLANNGTPQMPVCVGAKVPFSGTNLVSPGTSNLHEGLLYDCDDPLYGSAGLPRLFCVQSRVKIGGGAETIVIQVNDFGDPDFW